mgnify:CR=1 FL=1
MFITKNNKINLSSDSLITTNVIILMGLFNFSCENTITKSSDSNYGVVINEINYNSSNDLNSEDWVELHNSTNEIIEIDLWEFKDSNNDNVFTLPENTVLLPESYLVICKNLDIFSQVFSGTMFTRLKF